MKEESHHETLIPQNHDRIVAPSVYAKLDTGNHGASHARRDGGHAVQDPQQQRALAPTTPTCTQGQGESIQGSKGCSRHDAIATKFQVQRPEPGAARVKAPEASKDKGRNQVVEYPAPQAFFHTSLTTSQEDLKLAASGKNVRAHRNTGGASNNGEKEQMYDKIIRGTSVFTSKQTAHSGQTATACCPTHPSSWTAQFGGNSAV